MTLTVTTAKSLLKDLNIIHHRTPNAVIDKVVGHLFTYAQLLADTFIEAAENPAGLKPIIPKRFRGKPNQIPTKSHG